MIPAIVGGLSALSSLSKSGGGSAAALAGGDKRLYTGVFQVGGTGNTASQTAVENDPERAAAIVESTQPFTPAIQAAETNKILVYGVIGIAVIGSLFFLYKLTQK